MENYFKELEKEAEKAYEVARKAREKGKDPKKEVETPPAKDMAARVEGITGPEKVAERIRELQEKDKSREEIEFQVIEDIVKGKYGEKGSKEEKISQAVRTALAIETEGVTVSCTDGISEFKIKNEGNSSYLEVFFAGPIRAAGGTAEAKAVIFCDYARKMLGVGPYQATDKEAERYAEEVEMYHELIARLQYHPPEKEVKKIVKKCPICIGGVPTEQQEVDVHKNLDRIETNRLRGGMCLVLAEGVAQKKKKVLKTTQKHDIEWEWLEELIKVNKEDLGEEEEQEQEETLEPNEKFLSNVVGGRPVFSYPMEKGGFRLRYGKSRNNGIAAQSVHPAATEILEEFPAHGTQIKTERPGKAMGLTTCDEVEPPIVKLKNGTVKKIDSIEEAKEINSEVEEILFLGDILATYGDFLDENHKLVPSGICEEWWIQIAEKEGEEIEDPYQVSEKKAIQLSKEKNIPLHPKYTYHYGDVEKEKIAKLWKWLKEHGEFGEYESLKGDKVIELTIDNQDKKRILEETCIPHKVDGNNIKIEHGEALIETLGLRKDLDIDKLLEESKNSIELINKLSDLEIKQKAPVYVGTRMGRPEKAKPRKMSPEVHGLTPVGEEGGKQRLVTKAAEQKTAQIEKARLTCPECGKELFSYRCPDCGERAELMRTCTKCGRTQKKGEKCESCGSRTNTYHEKTLNMKKELERAKENLKEETEERKNTIKKTSNQQKTIPDKVKGVKGTTNPDHLFEPLEKTLLRAKHDVSVFMDGTIRFDAVDLPLTHFRPREIGTSVKKLKELGYKRDYKGNKLRDKEQILELKPNDILLPEKAVKHITDSANFIDELLEKYYDLDPYYNIEKKEDLVGVLTIGLAPHTSAGVLSRVIGFSDVKAGYAHPYFHCAKRRNCDGDEDGLMILLDTLLNFSEKYLPDRPGAMEDEPLVVSTRIDPGEIDDEVHAMETVEKYPLSFYEATQKMKNPRDVNVENVEDRLDTKGEFSGFKFTHDTSKFDAGPQRSSYTQLKSMEDKVDKQMKLGEKTRAVDEKDMATRLINFHFMKDIYGNLRAFGQQTFRCVDCNTKYRRVPLIGKCTECGGKILLTVHEKGIEKYLNISREIAEEYNLSNYLKQRLKLIEKDLSQIFESKNTQQRSLGDF